MIKKAQEDNLATILMLEKWPQLLTHSELKAEGEVALWLSLNGNPSQSHGSSEASITFQCCPKARWGREGGLYSHRWIKYGCRLPWEERDLGQDSCLWLRQFPQGSGSGVEVLCPWRGISAAYQSPLGGLAASESEAAQHSLRNQTVGFNIHLHHLLNNLCVPQFPYLQNENYAVTPSHVVKDELI